MAALRETPYDLTMERSALGAALSQEKWLGAVVSVLPTADCFYEPLHRDVYQAMLDLQNERKPVDTVTLSSKLQHHTAFQNAGGLLFLSKLQDDVAFPGRAEVYAREVYNKAQLRRTMAVADEIKVLCAEADAQSEAVLSSATQKLFSISAANRLGSLEILNVIMRQTIEQIEEQIRNAKSSRRVKTGFARLDKALSGLGNGTLNILAARPGVGKSSLALNIAQNAALIYGKTVAIFSLEMSKEEIAKRFFSSRGEIDSQNLTEVTKLQTDDWRKLRDAAGYFYNAGIYVDDLAANSPVEIMARSRQLKMERGLDLIIIDYLQLMTLKGRKESRQQEISEISRSLKLMAKELDVAVLALSQLNRESEKREENPRPKLSDLRESGSIEQDADTVMMIYREALKPGENQPQEAQKCELIIEKNRSGPTKTIYMGWMPKYTLFVEMSKIDEPDHIPPPGGDAAIYSQPASYGSAAPEVLQPSEDLSYLSPPPEADTRSPEDLAYLTPPPEDGFEDIPLP